MKINFIIIASFMFCTMYIHSQNDIFDTCRKGTVEEIHEVFKNNPNSINIKSEEGYSPLTLACYYGNEAVVKFLVERVNDINGTSDYGTPLMAAVVKDNLNIVKMLLDKKANPNIMDANGTTALHYAVLFNQLKTVKLLVNAEAEINIKDNRGQSALDYAILKNNSQIIALLKNN